MSPFKPIKTFDGQYHDSKSHTDPALFRARMAQYRAAYGRPQHNPQPMAIANIEPIVRRKK